VDKRVVEAALGRLGVHQEVVNASNDAAIDLNGIN